MKRKTLRILIVSLIILVVVVLLGKEGYAMWSNRYNYGSYDKRELNTAIVIDFKNLEDEQTLAFDEGKKYMIVGDMKDLKEQALLLEVLSDEEHYEGTNFVRMLTCKNDMLGREYCNIDMMSLRSRFVVATQPNEVVNSIECLLIDPFERQERDSQCYTIRLHNMYIADTKITVPPLRQEGKNRRKLLINGGNAPLFASLSVKKL